MHWADGLLFVIVVLAVPPAAAARNVTAAALVAAYVAMQAIYAADPALRAEDLVGVMFMIDVAVIGFIFAKASAKCPRVIEFPTARAHWRCMIGCLTHADRAVLVLFAAAWCLYVLNISPSSRWWGLWLVSVLQLLCASSESLIEWRRAKALPVDPGNPSSGHLRVAMARAGPWST